MPGQGFVGPYINYCLYWIIQHVLYLRGIEAESLVWSALQRFTAALRASAIQLVTGGDITYTDTAGAAALRTRVRAVPINGNCSLSGGVPAVLQSATNSSWIFNNAGFLNAPFRLPPGMIVRSAYVILDDNSTTPMVCTLMMDNVFGPGAATQLGATMTSSGAGVIQTLTTGAAADLHTATGAEVFYFNITGNNTDVVYTVGLNVNEPGFLGS